MATFAPEEEGKITLSPFVLLKTGTTVNPRQSADTRCESIRRDAVAFPATAAIVGAAHDAPAHVVKLGGLGNTGNAKDGLHDPQTPR